MVEPRKRRVLFFGAYDVGAGYPRARSLRQALAHHDVEVIELRETLLPCGGDRRKTVGRPWRWPKALLTLRSGQRRLRSALAALVAEVEADAIVVPYPGWFSVRDAREVFDGPVVLDLFLSLSDTVVADRRMFKNGGIVDRALRRIDRRACQCADRVFLDTPQHARAIAELTGVPLDKFGFVPIGDPDAPPSVTPTPALDGGPLRALYVGTGVPLHGVDTILSACARVDNVRLSFVGGTAEQREAAAKLGDRLELVLPWADHTTLRELHDLHHVAFGIFGSSDKASRVVPFKVVHALAHGRTVITAETPAVDSLLRPGDDCLSVPRASAPGLARALRDLIDGPKLLDMIGPRARRRYEQTFSPEAIGRALLGELAVASGEDWVPAEPRPVATVS